MLLAYNENRQVLYFGEYEVYDNGEFTANYNEVGLLKLTDDVLFEMTLNLLESVDFKSVKNIGKNVGIYIKEFNYDKVEKIAEKWINSYGFTIENVIDISLYPEVFFINDDDYYFESLGCGQLGIKSDNNIKYVNREFTEKLLEVWNKYHLKEIPQKELKELNKLYKKYYDDFNEYDFIENLIREWSGN